MLEYLKTQDAVELKEKFQTAIEIATLHHIDPRVIHLLRKELESLAFMTANIEDGVMIRTRKESAAPSESIASEWIGMKVGPVISHGDPS